MERRVWSKRIVGVVTLVAGCGTSTPASLDAAPATPTLERIEPGLGDSLGGTWFTVHGSALDGAELTVGGVPCTDTTPGARERRCRAPALAAGRWDVRATTTTGESTLPGPYVAWSPAELAGVRLFDARVGVTTAADRTRYVWERLTPEVDPEWRARDGNTLTWLPRTGRYWMVGGWNGEQSPDGFSSVPPGTVYRRRTRRARFGRASTACAGRSSSRTGTRSSSGGTRTRRSCSTTRSSCSAATRTKAATTTTSCARTTAARGTCCGAKARAKGRRRGSRARCRSAACTPARCGWAAARRCSATRASTCSTTTSGAAKTARTGKRASPTGPRARRGGRAAGS